MTWEGALGTRGLRGWDPFRDLERMQAEVNELFGRANDSWAPGTPPLHAWAGDDGIMVRAEVPGLDPGAIEISVHGDVLTLSGARTADEPAEGARALRRERGHGGFERSIRLPFAVEGEEVRADAKDGLLWIRLPRARRERSRRIEVRTH